MNININRKKAVYDAYMKGESVETLVLLTGFSRSTIENIIRDSTDKAPFRTRWSHTIRNIKKAAG